MVARGGFEPPTRGFSVHCSTPELPRQSECRAPSKEVIMARRLLIIIRQTTTNHIQRLFRSRMAT